MIRNTSGMLFSLSYQNSREMGLLSAVGPKWTLCPAGLWASYKVMQSLKIPTVAKEGFDISLCNAEGKMIG